MDMNLRACLIGAAFFAAPLGALAASGCGSAVTVIGAGGSGGGEGEGGFLFLDAGPDGPAPPTAGGPMWDALSAKETVDGGNAVNCRLCAQVAGVPQAVH